MSSPEPDEKRFQALTRALREADQRRSIFVPPTVDEVILKKVRLHFEGERKLMVARFIFALRWILGGAVAVVALCLLFLSQKPLAVAREDINEDGRVDILDALTLAKAVEGKNNNQRFDQNGDRQLDDSDVRAVALAAVRLDRKPGS
jgi:hypothetical protein